MKVVLFFSYIIELDLNICSLFPDEIDLSAELNLIKLLQSLNCNVDETKLRESLKKFKSIWKQKQLLKDYGESSYDEDEYRANVVKNVGDINLQGIFL